MNRQTNTRGAVRQAGARKRIGAAYFALHGDVFLLFGVKFLGRNSMSAKDR